MLGKAINLLEPFGEHLHIGEQSQRFFGLEMGSRMTVVDYTGHGDLLVHSPIRLRPGLVEALDHLGTVVHVVAPNQWHHLSVSAYQNQYPKATFWGAPGLQKKRRDLRFDGILEEGAHYPWSESLQHHLVAGCPKLGEVVFFHRPSKTLIVTDLGFNICEHNPWATRLFFKLMGHFGKYGWASIEKKLFIRDKKAFQRSVEKICDWDFENILLSHGRLIREDGKDHFCKAFARA